MTPLDAMKAAAELPQSLRSAFGTLAHNRAFSANEITEYTRFAEPTDGEHAVRVLTQAGLLKKVGGQDFYPTRKGWEWIEASANA